ncbi:hypothetical protein D3C86_1795620 [compost metagenome]
MKRGHIKATRDLGDIHTHSARHASDLINTRCNCTRDEGSHIAQLRTHGASDVLSLTPNVL